MSVFFAVGIALNVLLTGLALYWLWRQRMPRAGRDGHRNAAADPGTAAHASPAQPEEGNDYLADHAILLLDSFHRWTGRHLIEPGRPAAVRARELFEAPFVVASHGGGSDPVFNYANRAALALFETGWAAFTRMPSRLSAEPEERASRARLLERVNREGFIDDYSGVRVTAGARRFRIRNATVWNVIDARGAHRGQAVMFREWDFL